ncbi:MAG: guanosine monophosphate reductase [Spirochaetes bacterium]|nr:guanosine monophosphate reductase [Spirochaetota bacterium]
MIKNLAKDIINQSYDALTYDDVQIVPEFAKMKSRKNIDTLTRLVSDIYIQHPLIPANMDTITGVDMILEADKVGGAAFLHRFTDNIHQQINNINNLFTKNVKIIGVSLGVKSHDLWVAEQSYNAYIDRLNKTNSSIPPILVFVVDVAHGHHEMVGDFVYKLKLKYPSVSIIAGNVATWRGAEFLYNSGASGIKVGIGPGSLCTTRIETGVGVPQFSAVADIAHWRDSLSHDDHNTPTIIADGGIRHVGDIVKAIGAGANTVMSGYLFAGTSHTPGNTITKNGRLYKIYRGSASREAKLDRSEHTNIEGVSMEVPYCGETCDVFNRTLDGIRSGLSYAGMESVKQAVGQILFTKVSGSSIREAGPHATYASK